MTDTFDKGNFESVGSGSEEKFEDSTTKEKKSGVNLGFTTAFLFTVSLGMLNFGYAMSSFNSLGSTFSYLFADKMDNEGFLYK